MKHRNIQNLQYSISCSQINNNSCSTNVHNNHSQLNNTSTKYTKKNKNNSDVQDISSQLSNVYSKDDSSYRIKQNKDDNQSTSKYKISINIINYELFDIKSIDLMQNILPNQYHNYFQQHIISKKMVQFVQNQQLESLNKIQYQNKQQQQQQPNQIIDEIMKQIKQKLDRIRIAMISLPLDQEQQDQHSVLNLLQFIDLNHPNIIGIKVSINQPTSPKIYYFQQNNPEDKSDNSNNYSFIAQYNKLFQNVISQIIYLPMNQILIKNQVPQEYTHLVVQSLLKIHHKLFVNTAWKYGFIFQKIGCYRKQLEATTAKEEQIEQNNLSEEGSPESNFQTSSSDQLISEDSNRISQFSSVINRSNNFNGFNTENNLNKQNNKKTENKTNQLNRQEVIGMKIIGLRRNLHQFYMEIVYRLKMIPFKIIQISDIKSMEIKQLPDILPENSILLNHNTLLLMGNNSSLIKSFTIGKHILIKDDFMGDKKEENNDLKMTNPLVFLQKQCSTKRMKHFLVQNSIEYKSLIVNSQFLLMKSDIKNFEVFKEKTKQYIKQNFSQQIVKYDQLEDELIINVFLNYYQEQICNQYICQFFMDQNKRLCFKSFPKDVDEIKKSIQRKKDELINKFIYFPSLKPIQSYKAKKKEVQGLYKQIKNPKYLQLCNLKSTKICLSEKVDVIISPFTKYFHTNQQQLILLIHQEISPRSEILELLNSSEQNYNSSSPKNITIDHQSKHLKILNNFLAEAKGKSRTRVHKLTSKQSKVCKSIILIYFDIKNTMNYRYIDKDILSLLKSQQQRQQLKLIISDENSKKLIEQIIPRLMEKIYNLTRSSQIKLNCVSIFLQNYEKHQKNIEYAINKSSSVTKVSPVLKTHSYYIPEAFLRIRNMSYYKVYCYYKYDTYQVGGANAFFFNYQMERNKKMLSEGSAKNKRKALISLLQGQDKEFQQNQMTIDFREMRIYMVTEEMQVETYPFNLNKNQSLNLPNNKNVKTSSMKYILSAELFTLLQLINKYFKHLQFLVLHCTKLKTIFQNKLILGNCLKYNLFCTYNSQNSQKNIMIKLRISEDGKFKKNEEQVISCFLIQQTNYVEWFAIRTHSEAVNAVLHSLKS